MFLLSFATSFPVPSCRYDWNELLKMYGQHSLLWLTKANWILNFVYEFSTPRNVFTFFCHKFSCTLLQTWLEGTVNAQLCLMTRQIFNNHHKARWFYFAASNYLFNYCKLIKNKRHIYSPSWMFLVLFRKKKPNKLWISHLALHVSGTSTSAQYKVPKK